MSILVGNSCDIAIWGQEQGCEDHGPRIPIQTWWFYIHQQDFHIVVPLPWSHAQSGSEGV